ncbi:hypothetical protein CEF21_08070 [Bacillus sp. FJAT-42376]|nr:hypothetical protein CEF21_08070 [Bacillus sp. FJAT-42376]
MKSIIKSISLGMLFSIILFIIVFSLFDHNLVVGIFFISLLLGAVIGLLTAIYNKVSSLVDKRN